MKLTTTLALVVLAMGACSTRPAHAAPQCGTYSGIRLSPDPARQTYQLRFADGDIIEGKCGDGARWINSIPRMVADDIHTRVCGSGLNYVDR